MVVLFFSFSPVFQGIFQFFLRVEGFVVGSLVVSPASGAGEMFAVRLGFFKTSKMSGYIVPLIMLHDS